MNCNNFFFVDAEKIKNGVDKGGKVVYNIEDVKVKSFTWERI